MLEANLAALEGARFTGLRKRYGQMYTVLNLLSTGDHVICGNDVYGGNYRILMKAKQYA